MKNLVLSWGMVLLYVLLNAYGALALKHKINQIGPMPAESMASVAGYFLTLLKSPLAISATIAIFASAAVWMAALSRMQISIAYPAAVGLNFLLVVAAGLIIFGEPMTWAKGIGMILIIASVVLLSA